MWCPVDNVNDGFVTVITFVPVVVAVNVITPTPNFTTDFPEFVSVSNVGGVVP
jgi:hypothetical protein